MKNMSVKSMLNILAIQSMLLAQIALADSANANNERERERE